MRAALQPDSWDWVSVQSSPCSECGFDVAAVAPRSVASALVATLPRWQAALAGEDARVRVGPDARSTLEVAAHVRDVCQEFDERLRLMLISDDPQFRQWDREHVVDGYADLEPARVGAELAAAVRALALHLDLVSDDAWSRIGRRADGVPFTVASLAQFLLHGVLHHLYELQV